MVALSEVWRRPSFDRSKLERPKTLEVQTETWGKRSVGCSKDNDHIMAVTQDVRNKVVVRKLPPGISQEEVQAAIDVVCQGKYDWFTFVPGKVR